MEDKQCISCLYLFLPQRGETWQAEINSENEGDVTSGGGYIFASSVVFAYMRDLTGFQEDAPQMSMSKGDLLNTRKNGKRIALALLVMHNYHVPSAAL